MLQDPNIATKQGLDEMFDSTIGRTTVLAPYGGKYQLTKTQTSIHKIPTLDKHTNTVSMMAYGFNPYISQWSPYHGASYAVIDSLAKIVAAGGQENMSASPHVVMGSRDGQRMGNWNMVDSMIVDGLWDVYNQYHMGITAENVAKKYGITRDMQDALALASQQKAAAAQDAGRCLPSAAVATGPAQVGRSG